MQTVFLQKALGRRYCWRAAEDGVELIVVYADCSTKITLRVAKR